MLPVLGRSSRTMPLFDEHLRKHEPWMSIRLAKDHLSCRNHFPELGRKRRSRRWLSSDKRWSRRKNHRGRRCFRCPWSIRGGPNHRKLHKIRPRSVWGGLDVNDVRYGWSGGGDGRPKTTDGTRRQLVARQMSTRLSLTKEARDWPWATKAGSRWNWS